MCWVLRLTRDMNVHALALAERHDTRIETVHEGTTRDEVEVIEVTRSGFNARNPLCSL